MAAVQFCVSLPGVLMENTLQTIPATVATPTQPAIASLAEGLREYLSLTVAGQDYAIDILQVREIRGWVAETPLPNSPPAVRGVINLRGLVVPIYDLRARLGAVPQPPSATHVVIVVEASHTQYGLLADAVSDIVPANHDEWQPVPAMGVGQGGQGFIAALLSRGNRMISLLDLDRLTGLAPLAAAPALPSLAA